LSHLGSKVGQNETQIIRIKCSNPNCLIYLDLDGKMATNPLLSYNDLTDRDRSGQQKESDKMGYGIFTDTCRILRY
jgi:hypothetical protein